jgi:signal transduction histidine kinase
MSKKLKPLTEVEKLEHLIAISQAVIHSSDWKPAIDEITHLSSAVMLFDYLLIHQVEENDCHSIIYAKSKTPSQQQEIQFDWEDILADLVIGSQQTILQQFAAETIEIDSESPHYLGVPLMASPDCLGTLSLIRFGGPIFTQSEVRMAEFISQQITMLIERQILQREHELLETQRKQTRLQEDFISHITHELRNPLGCIKGYSTTLLRSDISWDATTQRQFLQVIDQETDRLQELINNLLDSAKLQTGQLDINFQLIRLDALIKDVISHTLHLNPDIQIHLEMSGTISPILGDPRRITQVLENIISNALKHAPKSDISIKIVQDDAGVRLSIQDYGSGIPKKHITNLFNRFFRVPDQAPNVHGSGLGLFICKQIIQAHRGQISATSIEEKGTTIHIYLPHKS